MSNAWDKTVDFLVVGSGAGGMLGSTFAAMNRQETLVIEKSDLWGGTSATSGGAIWVPNSPVAIAQGFQDSPEEAFKYIRALSADHVPDSLISAYVQYSPDMLQWVHDNTPVRFASIPYTDYHAELPGGKEGYRTHLATEFDGRLLGEDVQTLRPASPAASLLGKIAWKFTETTTLLYRPKGWWITAAKMFLRYYGDIPQRLRSKKDRFLTLGNCLMGGLRYAHKKAGGQLWLNTRMLELIYENGRVTGAKVLKDGKELRIGARKGVLLSTGGFERNPSMRAEHLKGSPEPVRSGSQINNTGDSIVAGKAIGASVASLDSAWWGPVWSIPGEDRGRLATIERALPHCIIVDQNGHRFLNEAASYHITGGHMREHNLKTGAAYPCWFIFDANYRWKYPTGPLLPMIPDWAHPSNVQASFKKADSVVELAAKIGMSAAALKGTVDRFNRFALQGKDEDFGRGDASYDKFYGDPRMQPNPSLGQIVKAPFYAMPIYPGDIGSNGGLVINEHGQVMSESGAPIPGLYAAGNTTASVMGRSYPGAGATLGPAMTFGYLAARHAAGVNA